MGTQRENQYGAEKEKYVNHFNGDDKCNDGVLASKTKDRPIQMSTGFSRSPWNAGEART